MEISPYIWAVGLAWIAAQGLKYVFMVVRHHKISYLRQLYLSGNMPSAHSAAVTSLVVMIGLIDGMSGAIFALALLFAAIVMYDAMMVRRSSGEQGAALQALIREQKSAIPLPRAARGHTPLEVACGSALGAVIAIIVFFTTK